MTTQSHAFLDRINKIYRIWSGDTIFFLAPRKAHKSHRSHYAHFLELRQAFSHRHHFDLLKVRFLRSRILLMRHLLSLPFSQVICACQLWLPTSIDEKYKAKQAIDTFFVRAGDVISAGLVFAGTTWLGLSLAGFGVANVLFVLLWLGLAALLWRENKAATARYQEAKAADDSPSGDSPSGDSPSGED